MLNQRLKAAAAVAEPLLQLEMLIDQAVQGAAHLTGALPAARIEAKLSALYGQDALDAVARATALLVSARRQIVIAHGALHEVKGQIGLGERAIGDVNEKPSAKGELLPLRAVA